MYFNKVQTYLVTFKLFLINMINKHLNRYKYSVVAICNRDDNFDASFHHYTQTLIIYAFSQQLRTNGSSIMNIVVYP